VWKGYLSLLKIKKAPLYDRVERNRQLLEHLRSTGQDPKPTRLRQTNMGQEQKKVKKPTSAVGQEVGYSFPRLNNPELKGGPFNDKKYHSEFKNKNFTHFYESPDKKVRAGIKHLGDNRYAVDHYGVREDEQEAGVGREGLSQLRSELEAHHGGPVEMTPTSITPSSQGFWDKMQSENITNMLKEAKSPKALAHKRKYETEYESSPARKKYRRELERERRKRGVAGKGGGDMSHTKTGKIVVENPHTNRARSHPSVGSTLKMVKIVKTEFAPPSEQGDNPAASTLFDPKTGKVGRSVVHGQPGMNPEEATRQVIHEDMHRATLPEVGIENTGHTEFPAMLGEELYLQRLAQEGKPHRKRDPHTLESSDPITQALYRTGKHSDVPKKQQKEYMRTFAERMNPIKVKKMVIVKNFNTCYQCGKTWEQLGLANALPIQRSLHEDRCMGMATSEKDSMFQQ